LNLEQITDTLNSEFKKEGRRLVFWYDEKQEFLSEIEELQLENAKLLVLREDDLFKTKILLERQEKETNYLIYAPFKRSENRENHLADTIMYSKVFLTDWISIMAQNLKIDDELKGVMEEHRKFFEAKDRREKFEKLVNDSKPSKKEDMEIILMRAITGSKAEIFDGFEDVTRILITDVNRKESRYLSEFKKYSLEEKFWDLCRLKFGYIDDEPNLTKLLLGIFLTYVSEKITKEEDKTAEKPSHLPEEEIFTMPSTETEEERKEEEDNAIDIYTHRKDIPLLYDQEESPDTTIEDKEFKVEIKQEEMVNPEDVARRLVEDFGEYDPTLELKSYQFPPIDLLKEYKEAGVVRNTFGGVLSCSPPVGEPMRAQAMHKILIQRALIK